MPATATPASTPTSGPLPFEQRRTEAGWLEWLPCMDDYAERFPEQAETLAMYRERMIYWASLIEQGQVRDPRRPNLGHTIPVEVAAAVILQESRGSPLAAGCDGEIGLFQILPGDDRSFIPRGCGGGRTVITTNPSTAWLRESRHNIDYGLSMLERLTWEAIAYADGQPAPDYRRWLNVAAPGTEETSWWYSDVGRVAVGMYQCGPAGFRAQACGERGGLEYAARVLDCWAPWVGQVLAEAGGDG